MTTQEPTSAPPAFVHRLRKEMAARGLSLRQLARQTDLSPAFLSRLLNQERGLPADETISRLEEVLDVQPRGSLYYAAGRADKPALSVFKKQIAAPLMRALQPLSNAELAQVLKVAERLAQKHHPTEP